MVNKDLGYRDLTKLLPYFEGSSLLDRSRTLCINQIELCSQMMAIHKIPDMDLRNTRHIPQEVVDMVYQVCEAVDLSIDQIEKVAEWDVDAEIYQQKAQQALTVRGAEDVQTLGVQGIASSIALIRSSQILFCWEILRCCEKLQNLSLYETTEAAEFSKSKIGWLKAKIHQSILDVLKLIPYTLAHPISEPFSSNRPAGSDALGHLLIWPLYVIAQCPLATPNQVSYSRQMLQKLGSSAGINTVYRLLE
jgi:hypothetical protein